MPSLSVIIPTLDEATQIGDALAALRPLRHSGVELIVVDGGSRDETRELAAPLAGQILLAPRGRATQMNAGAAKASGDTLLFLHADTRLPREADRLIAEGLRTSGRVWGRFDVTIDGRSTLLRMVGVLMNLRSRLTGIATGDQAMFMTRAAFQAAGGFPELPLMEDVALSKNLKRLGRPLCLRQRAVTSGRRWERRGVARTILLMWRLRLAYWLGAEPAELARRYGYDPPQREPVTTAILARAPIAGRAKTRLIPALGEARAAALQARLIDHTVRMAVAAGPVSLWATPDTAHASFQHAEKVYGAALLCQPDGDLGARIGAALSRSGGPTLVIGTDCPALTTEHLRACADALRDGNDAVVIPVDDGGYALIGMRKPEPALFTGITWGTASVMAETRERLRRLGLTWREPFRLWDIDVPEDLDRLRREGFADLLA